MKLLVVIFLLSVVFIAKAQAVVVINDATLVIDNPADDAVTRTDAGYIVSEGKNNRLIW